MVPFATISVLVFSAPCLGTTTKNMPTC